MVYTFENIELDEKAREVRRDGRIVRVEPRVFDLLLYLARHSDRVVGKRELFDTVWEGAAVGDAALSRCVSLARKALDSSELIRVVHGRGYRLVARLEHRESIANVPIVASRGNAPVSSSLVGPMSSFLGRQPQMAAAEERVQLAVQGRGGVCFVYGEAGIGKTRFLLELARRVPVYGAQPVRESNPDPEGTPPYWPWLQALRKVARLEKGNASIVANDSPGADLERVLDVAMAHDGTARAAPHRLLFFEQLADLVARKGDTQPLVLLLDDLHQLDVPSLHLLSYFASAFQDKRVLIVGAYRDPDLGVDAERSKALAPAWRCQVSSIQLPAFSVTQIQDLLRPKLPELHIEAVARDLHDRTGGNPFFVTQLMPLLEVDGPLSGRSELPDGVRSLIRQRVRDAGEECANLLGVAAVSGFSFEARALCVEGASFERVLASLQRGAAYNLVHETDGNLGRYEFVHGLVREVLYDDLNAKRRASLHGALAKRIEVLAGPDDERRLALLAHHLVRALPFGDAEAAIECLLRAGLQALRRYAYEAARHYLEQAIQIVDAECPNAHAMRVELLLHLAHAQEESGARDAAWVTIELAAQAAQPLPPLQGIVRVALESAHGLGLNDSLFVHEPRRTHLLREAIDALGATEPRSMALLKARLALSAYTVTSGDERAALCDEAEHVAARLLDDALRAELAHMRLAALWSPDNWQDRERWAALALQACERIKDYERLLAVQHLAFALALEQGSSERLREAIEDFTRTAQMLRLPPFILDGLHAVTALLAGNLPKAEALCAASLQVYQRLPLQMVQQGFQALVSALKLERESSEDVVSLLMAAREQTKLVKAWQAFTAFAFARLGRLDEARFEFEDMALHDFHMPRDTTWLGAMAMLAEVCAELGDVERASALYERLLPFSERHAVVGVAAFTLGSIQRFLALLSFVRSDYDCAVIHFEAALKSNLQAGARLFVAYTQYDYSRLLRRRDQPGDRDRAEALLESATDLARACGSTCLLRRIS